MSNDNKCVFQNCTLYQKKITLSNLIINEEVITINRDQIIRSKNQLPVKLRLTCMYLCIEVNCNYRQIILKHIIHSLIINLGKYYTLNALYQKIYMNKISIRTRINFIIISRNYTTYLCSIIWLLLLPVPFLLFLLR